jgi:hypothetical protein
MNNSLNQAEKWVTELGIRTLPIESGRLGVNRDDMMSLGITQEELLSNLKDAVSRKLFLDGTFETLGWVYLSSF